MSSYLNIDSAVLKANNSVWTAREIAQQPRVWREAYNAIEDNRTHIDSWLQPLLSKANLRIVLSGAGTSAFIGEALAPWLRKQLKRRVEAVSTTDIVSDPGQYLADDVPTLMISFARSGDSPESVASVNLANQVLSDCYHLVLTCNKQGYLAKSAIGNKRILCLLMPEGTNDRSFAMTSSFSSMLVACATVFAPQKAQLECAITATEQLLASRLNTIQALAKLPVDRLVVLGAGSLLGIAREASLKCLELTAGKVVPMFDTPLGFRHGPKSVVNGTTLIIHLCTNDSYIQSYDVDLWEELERDAETEHLVRLSPSNLSIDDSEISDIWLSLPYTVYCQLFAFYKALSLGVSADNPCPSGKVNRVVKGVSIYPYNAE